MRFGSRLLPLAVLITAFLLGTPPTMGGGAQIIHVPGDYPTIQQVIDAAVGGDTILVAPGTYTENINFKGKTITVKSEVSRKVTIIDGGQKDSVVTFASGEGRNSVLDGFTIRNGRSGFDTPGFGDGGGVRIDNASPTVLRNAIVDNKACDGLGISIDFGSPLIKRNLISRNVRVGCSGGVGGGGIKIGGAAAAEIVENEITFNVIECSLGGGGISLFAAGTPVILGNVIIGNRAKGCGDEGRSIAMVNYSDATIVGNIVVKNEADEGGGVFWLVPFGSRGPALVNNTIADNIAPTGPQLFADGFDTQALLVNNVIVAGFAQTAVYCGDSGDQDPPTFQYNNVFAPSGTRYGGVCTDQTGRNGNISVNPRFTDAVNGDYHLLGTSRVIDKGSNSAPYLPKKDIDHQPRIIDGDGNGSARIDMGADEFAP